MSKLCKSTSKEPAINSETPTNVEASVESHFDRQTIAAPTPLLVTAKAAAAMLGIGKTLFYQLHAQGRVPMPIRLSSAVRWNVRELQAWTAAGCPARDRWQAMKGAKRA